MDELGLSEKSAQSHGLEQGSLRLLPWTAGCREAQDSHHDQVKGVFYQRRILDKSYKDPGPDPGSATH